MVLLDLNMPIMDGFEASQMIFKTFDQQVMFQESKSYMIQVSSTDLDMYNSKYLINHIENTFTINSHQI